MDRKNEADAEELFKSEYESWDELDHDGICDNINVVCIYPVDSKPASGLEMENFSVTDYEIEKKEISKGSLKADSIEAYELSGEDESAWFTADILETLLETFDKDVEDLILYEGTKDFPAIIDLDDPDWNTMIAPRIPPTNE